MARFKVTPEQLGATADKLQSLSEQYTEIYVQLFKEAGTMGEAWEGDDNRAYVAQINTLCSELKAMATKLTTCADALKQDQKNYVTRQSDNIVGVKKL